MTCSGFSSSQHWLPQPCVRSSFDSTSDPTTMQQSSLFSPHRDLLEAPDPATESETQKFLEELKRRGRAAVQGQSWRDAEALYQKGVTLNLLPNSEKAILSANLSLTQGKMNLWKEAAEAAESASKLDPTYVKAWWRLGQAQAALKEFPAAETAMKKALSLDNSSKAIAKELEKIEQAAKAHAEEQAKLAEAKAAAPEPAPPLITKTVVKEPKKETAESSKPMEVDDTEFTKSDHVKGYKIVNGKKTSFFHNELDEETKNLIGDIAPKKIDQPIAPQNTSKDTSAWNMAGTWEEKDCTKWAQDSLSSKLGACTFSFPESSPAPSAALSITESKVTGHASVVAVRGKKRYVYELAVRVSWEFRHGNVTATGTMEFPDIDDDDLEVEKFEIKSADDPNVRPLLGTFCRQGGLRPILEQCIRDWVEYFKASY